MTRAALPRAQRGLLYLLGVLLIVGLWSGGSLVFGRFIVPTPWETLRETVRLAGQPHTWAQVSITCLRVVVGFAAALLAGGITGMLTGMDPRAEALLRPLVMLLQGVPPLLWAIPLILVLGIGHLSPMLVIALICFPLVAVNVHEGVRSAPPALEQMLWLFAPGLLPRLRELVLPHLRPFLAAAVRLGLVLGIKASVTGEYFGSNDGIGFQLQSAYQALQARRLFAWGLLLVGLIIGANALLSRLRAAQRRARRRGRTGAARGALRLQPAARGGASVLAETIRRQARPGALGLRGVHFRYPKGRPLLADLDLQVGPGEIAVISGDSGTGKTTLLNLLAGLLRPSAGTVSRPERLGVVFQDDRLLPWSSCLWNVALPLVYGGQPREQALALAGRLMAEAGLAGKEAALPEELSGGMKKRLCFARCFARFPDAILLDEPFTGLDAEARRLLWQKFTELLALHRGAVLIITHFPDEVPVPERCRFYRLAAEPDRGFAASLLPAAR